MLHDQEPFERPLDSLEELVDTLSELLACSVTIEDANHSLVAYSTHLPESDPARISTIVGRKVPEKIIQTLWREGIFQQIVESDMPVRVTAIPEIGLGDRIVAAIRKNQDILGYIWVQEERQLDDRAMQHLRKAAKLAMPKLLQLQAKRLREDQGQQEFLWQLLTGHIQTDEAMSAAQHKYKIQLPSLYCVTMMQFAAEINEKLYRQIHYMMTTSFNKRVILHAASGDQLILLENKSLDRSVSMYTQFSEEMKLRFSSAPVLGGSGLICDHYSKVEDSYQEALAVMRVKMKFTDIPDDVSDYAKLGFYRILPMLHSNRSEMRYRNPVLNRLEQYDFKVNGNLLQTLEAYLQHNCHMKATADALHIHENTLSYRLKRITEVSGMNLNSMDEKVSCYLDMKIKVYKDHS